jgi:hypothetical protein
MVEKGGRGGPVEQFIGIEYVVALTAPREHCNRR